MEIEEPEFRCGRNPKVLADLFNYKIGAQDQDWTYTAAEPERIDDYIRAYDNKIKDDDTKFSLMEMVIQSLTEQHSDEVMILKWAEVKELLTRDFDLHKYTIFYWCCWDNEDVNDCWKITPYMRELWRNKW